MPLIKGDRIVDDPWIAVDDEEGLPEGAPAIVGLARWRAERDTLAGRNAPLGIRLRADQPPGEIAADLDRFQVIAPEFPSFGDGRAYPYARLLRARPGHRGARRAVGQLLRSPALVPRRDCLRPIPLAGGVLAARRRSATRLRFSAVHPARSVRPDGNRNAGRAVVCPRAIVLNPAAKLGEQEHRHVVGGIMLSEVVPEVRDSLGRLAPQQGVRRTGRVPGSLIGE